MKGYSTPSWTQETEPHHQMQFSIIPKTPIYIFFFCGRVLLSFCTEYSQHIQSLGDLVERQDEATGWPWTGQNNYVIISIASLACLVELRKIQWIAVLNEKSTCVRCELVAPKWNSNTRVSRTLIWEKRTTCFFHISFYIERYFFVIYLIHPKALISVLFFSFSDGRIFSDDLGRVTL